MNGFTQETLQYQIQIERYSHWIIEYFWCNLYFVTDIVNKLVDFFQIYVEGIICVLQLLHGYCAYNGRKFYINSTLWKVREYCQLDIY